MTAHGEACGKFILAGEHAVVYGARALAAPLFSRTIEIHLHPDGQDHFTLNGRPVSEPAIIDLLQNAKKIFDVNHHIAFECTAKIPVGAGLGSSAALCVALVRALAAHSGRELSPDQVSRHANELEKIFHGSPSGLDSATVAQARCLIFSKKEGIRLLPKTLPRPFHFLLIDTGERSSTRLMIEKAAPYFQQERENKVALFDHLTDDSERALLEGDSGLMAGAFRRSYTALEAAGVVTERMKFLTDQLYALGITAVKPTGAGGGGCLLGLLEANETASFLASWRVKFPDKEAMYVEL